MLDVLLDELEPPKDSPEVGTPKDSFDTDGCEAMGTAGFTSAGVTIGFVSMDVVAGTLDVKLKLLSIGWLPIALAVCSKLRGEDGGVISST